MAEVAGQKAQIADAATGFLVHSEQQLGRMVQCRLRILLIVGGFTRRRSARLASVRSASHSLRMSSRL
jgi:hypothetical protein